MTGIIVTSIASTVCNTLIILGLIARINKR